MPIPKVVLMVDDMPVCFDHTVHDVFVVHSGGRVTIMKFVIEIDTIAFEFCKSDYHADSDDFTLRINSAPLLSAPDIRKGRPPSNDTAYNRVLYDYHEKTDDRNCGSVKISVRCQLQTPNESLRLIDYVDYEINQLFKEEATVINSVVSEKYMITQTLVNDLNIITDGRIRTEQQRRSLRERWREGPGPGGNMPAPAGTPGPGEATGGARAGDDIPVPLLGLYDHYTSDHHSRDRCNTNIHRCPTSNKTYKANERHQKATKRDELL
ncbi:hypothetical protein EVAR_36345_1 [Eumeta japonica]|uniref:Uncharacterized protein n=1 Tax=Eumeta variegata TaxID=151549 RepID=A0A4C1W4A8_EUMVA|nr:hypothetical protein EVAR_36345_1 [Eumeta japonica]